MDDIRKHAYRSLLYRAMLDIRPLAWHPPSALRLLNPFLRHREIVRVRRAGAVADWLHNLAAFAADDFEGFDEQWFWREHESVERHHPEYDLALYKQVFELALAGRVGPP
jgi:hypothetical protein